MVHLLEEKMLKVFYIYLVGDFPELDVMSSGDEL